MKHLFVLVSLCCVFSIFHIQAQSCRVNQLRSQADIDQFPSRYPGCTMITENLRISSTDGEVFNLDSLQQVQVVEGSVILEGSSVQDLQGLSNLREVKGDLILLENVNLADLTGLSALSSVQNIQIEGMDALVNLEGIGAFDTLRGSLTLKDNPNMLSLAGLDAIRVIGENIEIFRNQRLTSLAGLDQLTSIHTWLDLRDNPELSTLENLRALTRIGDYLSLQNLASLQNLTGLSSIKEIGRSVFLVENPNLVSLTNFDGLNALGEHLLIESHPLLTDISGLSQLQEINGYLFLKDVPLLEDLDGLNNLKQVGEFLQIEAMNSLSSVSALSQLQSIGESLFLINNSQLDSLAGLEQLTTIPGDVVLNKLERLENLEGLNGLQMVEGYMLINENPALMSLTGLDSLITVGRDLVIRDNESLQSLSGLEALEFATLSFQVIERNSSLSACEIEAFCAYLNEGDTSITFISDNATGCNSIAEVQEACEVYEFQPVEWLVFEGEQVDQGVWLRWVTASEGVHLGFAVESSEDNRAWKSIDFVATLGPSDTAQAYEYVDPAPLNDRRFYRIRQVGINGELSSSPVLTLDPSAAIEFEPNIYPNPSFGLLNVDVPRLGTSEFILCDRTGRIIMQKSIQGQNQIDLTSLNTGMYHIRITLGDAMWTRRLILMN